ncbi:MAG TPA: hypothetical protein VFR84_17960 [Candidatus Angelobacter sp.]|nr:hypothetical protein [Candidatus Angelobacter sp.]
MRPTVSQDVQITGDAGQVDQDSVRISRDTDEVTWTAHGAHKAIVVFASPDGSPFHDAVFQVPANGSVSSGPVKSSALNQPYKYTVVGQIGVNDPIVIIDS